MEQAGFCHNHHSHECKTFYDLFTKYKFFYIPDYQRHFVWDEEQISLLIDTLEQNHNKSDEPWLGSIMLSLKDNKVYIIDGQQRIVAMLWMLKLVGVFSDNEQVKIHRSNEYQSKIKQISSDLDKIISYLSGEGKESDKIKKIQEIIKRRIQNKVSFYKYLLKQVYISIIWFKKEKYEYFENLNSKSIKLTLAEKCLAFLATHDQNLYRKNLEAIIWIIDKNRTPEIKVNDFKDDGSQFFKTFINIYCEKSNIIRDPIIRFKKFIESSEKRDWLQKIEVQNPIDFFYKFLNETFKFLKKDYNQPNIELYLKKICLQNFWWWYIEIMILKDEELKKLFNEKLVWLDIGKAIWNFKKTFTKNNAYSFINNIKILNGNKNYIFSNFYKTYISKTNLLDNNQIKSLVIAGGATSRVKLIIFLANYWIKNFCDAKERMRKSKVKDKIEVWLHNNGFILDFFDYYLELEVEHLLPKTFKSTYELKDDESEIKELDERLNSLENLILLSKSKNCSMGNQTIGYKIRELFEENYMEERNRHLFSNIHSLWKNHEKESTDVVKKIKSFLKDRSKKINTALNQINENIKNKFESPYSTKKNSHDFEPLLKMKGFRKIEDRFWKKEDKYYWIKSFTLEGQGEKRRLPFGEKNRDEIKLFIKKNGLTKEKEPKIVGFHPVRNSLFLYKLYEKAVYRLKGHSSLHFNDWDWSEI